MTIDAIIDGVLEREGGFSDRLQDRGGPTNRGITAVTLGQWRKLGRPATREEVRTLTEAEAWEIYLHEYVIAPRFDRLPADLRPLMVDFGVHSGPARATKALQRALGVVADGVIGPKTMAALIKANWRELYRAVLKERGELLAALMQQDPSQRVFAAGWMRRLMEFV